MFAFNSVQNQVKYVVDFANGETQKTISIYCCQPHNAKWWTKRKTCIINFLDIRKRKCVSLSNN